MSEQQHGRSSSTPSMGAAEPVGGGVQCGCFAHSPGTMRGMLEMTMGSRKTVPLRMLRIVPLGPPHLVKRGDSGGCQQMERRVVRSMPSSVWRLSPPVLSSVIPAFLSAPPTQLAAKTSSTRCSSGVMVAHLMPTLNFLMAFAASIVTCAESLSSLGGEAASSYQNQSIPLAPRLVPIIESKSNRIDGSPQLAS